MSMTDLITFLNARLEEDESRARATLRLGGPSWDEVGRGERIPEMAHIERHSPARVLRDVEAKRAIMAEHFILTNENRDEAYEEFSVVPWGAKGGAGDQGAGCVTCHYYGMGGVKGYGICRTVRLLAAIWSDHPDYRDEWKPRTCRPVIAGERRPTGASEKGT